MHGRRAGSRVSTYRRYRRPAGLEACGQRTWYICSTAGILQSIDGIAGMLSFFLRRQAVPLRVATVDISPRVRRRALHISPLSVDLASAELGALASVRTYGDTFGDSYLRALESIASSPGFSHVIRDASQAGSITQPSFVSDVALLCFVHGYRDLDAVSSDGAAIAKKEPGAKAAKDLAAERTAAPMVGCTVGSFRYSSSIDPFVSLTAIKLPQGGIVEPWFANGSTLPQLADYAARVKADSSHFLAVGSPDVLASEKAALLARLSAIFPSARIACGTAMEALTRTSRIGSAHLFSSFAPLSGNTTAVGFALHMPPGELSGAAALDVKDAAQRLRLRHAGLVERAIVASFGDVEFPGVDGLFCNPQVERRLFVPRGVTVGPVRHSTQRPLTQGEKEVVDAAAAAQVTKNAANAVPSPALAPISQSPLSPLASSPRTVPGPEDVASLPAGPLPRPLPIFMIDTAILPGQSAHFRVFESRYRHMLRRHFETGELFALSVPPQGIRDARDDGAQSNAADDGGAELPQPGRAVSGTVEQWSVATALGTDAPFSAAPAVDVEGPSRGQRGQVATVVAVRAVHAVDKDSGRLAVQLQGVRRVRLADSWVAPGTFGLVHARAAWMDDGIEEDLPAEASGATGDAARGAPAAAQAAAVLELLGGVSPAHVRLRQLLRKWDDARRGAGPWSTPPPHLVPSSLHGSGGVQSTPRVTGTYGSAGSQLSVPGGSPESLSWWLADVLPVRQSVRQVYLESTSTADRLSRQLAFLSSKLADLAPGATASASAASAGGAGGTSAGASSAAPGDGEAQGDAAMGLGDSALGAQARGSPETCEGGPPHAGSASAGASGAGVGPGPADEDASSSTAP